MGPSGAGKTSLLDILAGRKFPSGGDLSLGRQLKAGPGDIQRYSAYVQQDDAIMATQTCREAMTMAALLCLPGDMPRSKKLERATEVMKTFHLDKCADTVVGDPIGKVKGLSGGERKRCAVAMAAIREPKIFFLDEPTSGLDSYKALVLVQVMKDMARNCNSTVVCTIHQPSSDIFALFDDLMLLLNGKVVYHGVATAATEHFGTAGYPCPQYANPADFFFMHVLTSQTEGTEDNRTTELSEFWSKAAYKTEMDAKAAKLVSVGDVNSRPYDGEAPVVKRSSCCLQYSVLFWRGLNDIKRNPMRGRAFIAQSVVMALIIAVIWWGVGNDQNSIQDRIGVMFFMTTNGMMTNVMGVLTTFGSEKGAVLREQENGMYTSFPYFCSRVLCDLPLKMFGPLVFGVISYWAVGLQPELDKFLVFLAIIILLALAGNAMGLFVACMFSDVQVALAVAPMFLMPLIMFSGFIINPDSIPIYLKWVEWIAPTKYAFAAIAQNEFEGLSLHCTDSQIRMQQAEDGQMVRVCNYNSGDEYIKSLNIQEILNIQACCLLLLAIAVGFTCLAYFALVMISNKNQKAKVAKKGSSGQVRLSALAEGEQPNVQL